MRYHTIPLNNTLHQTNPKIRDQLHVTEYHVTLYHAKLHYTISQHTTLHQNPQYHTMETLHAAPHHITPYHSTPQYQITTLYHSTAYHIALHNNIPQYTSTLHTTRRFYQTTLNAVFKHRHAAHLPRTRREKESGSRDSNSELCNMLFIVNI